jgi:hypothetical protein
VSSAFAVPLLFSLVCIILVWWKLHKTPTNQPVLARVDREGPQRTNLSRDAVLGGILLVIFAAGLCLISHFISAGVSRLGPWIYLLLFSVMLSGPLFVWHQWQTRSKPLVDFRVICESPRWQIFLATFLREGATVGVRMPSTAFESRSNKSVAAIPHTMVQCCYRRRAVVEDMVNDGTLLWFRGRGSYGQCMH